MKFITVLKGCLLIIVLFVVLFASLLLSLYVYEAVSQKENFFSKSGNCRIVNTKLAYNNNYNLELHSIKFIDSNHNQEKGYHKIEDGYHVFAVDNKNKVHDISNKNNFLDKDYNSYLKNFLENKKLITFYLNGNGLRFKIEDYSNKETYISILNTYIHYFVYKIFYSK